MNTQLPIISSIGYFQSKNKFSNPNRYPECSVSKLRTVTDYEIEIFTQDGGISHINHQSYPITKGALLIAKPGDKRQSTLHFCANFIHFTTNEPQIQKLIHSISGFHSDTGIAEWATTELNAICEKHLHFNADNNIYASAKLLIFLYELQEKLQPYLTIHRTNGSDTSIIGMAIEFIRENYMLHITVAEIASHCCISPSYLYKLFMDIVHTTPNNYLINVRISEAKNLLETTDMSISRIAMTCGFNCQSYFCTCFKKHFHVTPKEIRSRFMPPC